ncbi:MAG: hypothetical protein D6696_08760 [Acidobacteria bacterium]|nr:MAG: hypothetical protein D6696_08760 [Acidobacteriota bacterium]
MRWRIALAAAALAAGVAAAAGGLRAGGEAGDPVAALNEGNRLFRDGRLEEAAAAYEAGWDPASPHPTLAYNLGTTLHHLDRLPEAILWYRRAGDAAPDPWLEENLWLARRTLGSQVLPAGGVEGLISRHRQALRLAAAAVAWLVLGLLVALPRTPAWVLVLLAALAASLYAGAGLAERFGARPAVLLADCSTPAGDLPAGTEAWVRPLAGERYRIVARSADAVCPAPAVALIEPPP